MSRKEVAAWHENVAFSQSVVQRKLGK